MVIREFHFALAWNRSGHFSRRMLTSYPTVSIAWSNLGICLGCRLAKRCCAADPVGVTGVNSLVKPGWAETRVAPMIPRSPRAAFQFRFTITKISASNERSSANGIVTRPVVWISLAEKLKGNRDEDETVV